MLKETVQSIKVWRRENREQRQAAFKAKVVEILERFGISSETQNRFICEQIVFERNIDKILQIYQKLVESSKMILTMSDIDGVLVAPPYRHDWANRDYPNLTKSISKNSQKIILFSSAIKIPAESYRMLHIFGVDYWFPNWLSGHLPLLVPDPMITTNQGYRSLPIPLTQGILLDLVDPYRGENIPDDPVYPVFEYLDKKDKSSRQKCMQEMLVWLENGGVINILGSSIIDRLFFLAFLEFVSETVKSYSNLDPEALLRNINYLDSDLTFI